MIQTLVDKGGWRFFNAFNATAAAALLEPWLDVMHFEQRIYRGLNELLLEDLLGLACTASPA